MPHFDFERMTALADGPYRVRRRPSSNRSSARSSARFDPHVYRALTQYRDETIDSSRCAPMPNDRGHGAQRGYSAGTPAGADRLRHDEDAAGWKAYDVIVGGVSLVTNYRDEFNEQVQAGGIDGLIDLLADKNAGGSCEVTRHVTGTPPRSFSSSPAQADDCTSGALTFDDASRLVAAQPCGVAGPAVIDLAGLKPADSSALLAMIALSGEASTASEAGVQRMPAPSLRASTASTSCCKIGRSRARLSRLTVARVARRYGTVQALAGVELRHRARRVLRPARPERRRQDDADLDPRGPGARHPGACACWATTS